MLNLSLSGHGTALPSLQGSKNPTLLRALRTCRRSGGGSGTRAYDPSATSAVRRFRNAPNPAALPKGSAAENVRGHGSSIFRFSKREVFQNQCRGYQN
jgi:hypothetical protein